MKSLIVTGAHHRAICALYEKQLEQQRGDWKDDVAVLAARAEAAEKRGQELHEKILEMMTAPAAAAAPGPVPVPRRRVPVRAPEAVDPNDVAQVFAQAANEVGMHSATRVLRRMEHIQSRLRPHGPLMQKMAKPNQLDVQRMIDEAELNGLTMPPIASEVS